MTRKFSVALALGVALFVARGASAAVITPTDLDTWLPAAGPQVLASIIADPFAPAPPGGSPVGSLFSGVFRNPITGEYTYLFDVTPDENNVMFFNTGFPVAGFTGTAGWDFGDPILGGGSIGAGGCGGPVLITCPFGDFLIQGGPGSQLNFMAFDRLFDQWDATETIRFFYVSTQAPREGGNYNLTAGSTGTAQGFAPVPEPGSMMLLGSGLAALYGAVRRRSVKH